MKNPWEVRPEVASFASYEAGISIEEIAQKYGLSKVVKLASNENPFGISPKVQAVLQDKIGESFRYPAAKNPRLVQAIAQYYGKKYSHIKPEQIFIGNGSDELIDLLFRVRIDPAVQNAVAFKPCFGLYETQAQFHGCALRQAPLRDDFSFDVDALLELVDENTALVLITNPDNPSGRLMPKEDMIRLAKSLPSACLLVIDEAYIEFAEADLSLLSDLPKYPNVAIMRTFSKVYGLAGLRIGYAILPEELAEYLWRVRLPFSLNYLAQEAAITALFDDDFRKKTIEHVEKSRTLIMQTLKDFGCEVIPSASNFIMFKPPKDAILVHQKLLEKGYIIRSLKAYGLAKYLRVNVGLDDENTGFLHTLQSILES